MSAVAPQVLHWLKTCGLSDRLLARCTPETRVYQDLGVYGEIAEGWMESLADGFGVDLTGFELQAHFPPEFPGRNMAERALISMIPFAGAFVRSREEYPPVTLCMVDAAIRNGKWPEEGADA